MADLSELLGRVRAASGADQSLDWELTQWADPRAVKHSSAHLHYTASVDGALALVERMGWRLYTVDASIEDRFRVMLAGPKRARWSDELQAEVTIPDYACEVHSDHRLAILAALLSALSTPKEP